MRKKGLYFKNKIILITGSLGLIGFYATKFFLENGYKVIGIDNDFRGKIFNIKTNFKKKLDFLKKINLYNYEHYSEDIRNNKFIENIFAKNGNKISLIIHTAAQTSHDWSAKNPIIDFYNNCVVTFHLLQSYRKYCPKAVFIFTSTNKVYGDRVNFLPLRELKTRFDLPKKNQYFNGIDENFPIDQSIHSPFGVSKTSADLMVQEYGRYFDLYTGIFRLGVISGGWQNGVLEQGFLDYMLKKIINDKEITIIGYKGKQVRDIIHAEDIVLGFWEFYQNPKKGEVYNLGGGRSNAFSILELIEKIKKLTRKKIQIEYISQSRKGDHKWWITDFSKFKKDYPSWKITRRIDDIILDIYNNDFSR